MSHHPTPQTEKLQMYPFIWQEKSHKKNMAYFHWQYNDAAPDPFFLISAKNPMAVFPKIKKLRIRTLKVFQAINI